MTGEPLTTETYNLAEWDLCDEHMTTFPKGTACAVCSLHAAAPDLLKALKELYPSEWYDGTMDHMPGIKTARLAIAKAEGRS